MAKQQKADFCSMVCPRQVDSKINFHSQEHFALSLEYNKRELEHDPIPFCYIPASWPSGRLAFLRTYKMSVYWHLFSSKRSLIFTSAYPQR